MAVRIQLRRDTAANWASSNPILRAGEIGIETDTNKMKIGTGSAAWNSISVYANLTPATAASTYAPLASPALTGTPTAPTANAGTNSTQIATTAFVTTAVANLIDSAPGTLDTLNELAAAINDNASFAATIATSLIPSQTGSAGKYLTTDGTTASWAPAATETPHPFAMIG